MKCIIIDDEPLARKGVMLLLELHAELQVVGNFNQATTALDYVRLNPVDLIFLDIHMPGLNGLEFARQLGKNTMIIFITAHAEYALDSYEVEAIDYLVKPIQPARFNLAVQKALAYADLLKQASLSTSLEFTADFLFVRSERQYVKVALQDIFYIEGLKDYVILHLAEQKIITAMNLKKIHGQLPLDFFIRVSKSYIVNVTHIQAFDNNNVTILDKEIPIGSSFRDAFFDRVIRKGSR